MEYEEVKLRAKQYLADLREAVRSYGLIAECMGMEVSLRREGGYGAFCRTKRSRPKARGPYRSVLYLAVQHDWLEDIHPWGAHVAGHFVLARKEMAEAHGCDAMWDVTCCSILDWRRCAYLKAYVAELAGVRILSGTPMKAAEMVKERWTYSLGVKPPLREDF